MLADGCLQIEVFEVDLELENIEVAILIELETQPPREPLGEFRIECEVAAPDPGADNPLGGWIVVRGDPVGITEQQSADLQAFQVIGRVCLISRQGCRARRRPRPGPRPSSD